MTGVHRQGILNRARVLVLVSGGIAAFKAVHLVRTLMGAGAEVRVILSRGAKRFVGAATFQGITGRAPYFELWAEDHDGEIHVELARWADAMVVCPATAHTLARMALGMADDLLTTTALCASATRVIAPAMHHRMWGHPAVQRHVKRLAEDGATFVGPVHGALANGETGDGRMAEPEAIVDVLCDQLRSVGGGRWASADDLAGMSLLVTAGPTRESLDPIRYFSNRSSGRMGVAIAVDAARRGARVCLVHGPLGEGVRVAQVPNLEVVPVETALDMHGAVMERARGADAVVMAAAVADYRPEDVSVQKIKKGATGDSVWQLGLVRNPDILWELGHTRSGDRPVLVGFAAESEALLTGARSKLVSKGVDLMVANSVDAFAAEENQVTFVTPRGDEAVGRMTKVQGATIIVDRVRDLVRSLGST